MVPSTAGAHLLLGFLCHVFVPGLYGSFVPVCPVIPRSDLNSSSACPYMVTVQDTYVTAKLSEAKVVLTGQDQGFRNFTVYATTPRLQGKDIGGFINLPPDVAHLNCTEDEFVDAIGASSNTSRRRLELTWRGGPLISEHNVTFTFVPTYNGAPCVKTASLLSSRLLPTTYRPTIHANSSKNATFCVDAVCPERCRRVYGYSRCTSCRCAGSCQLNAEFECSNSDCVPATWVCDGTSGCPDGSDEDLDRCNAPVKASWLTWLRNAGVGVAVLAVMILFFYFLYKTYVKKQRQKRAELPLLGNAPAVPDHVTRITLSPSPLLGRRRPGNGDRNNESLQAARSLMDMSRPSDRLKPEVPKSARSMNDVTRSGAIDSKAWLHGSAGNVTRDRGMTSQPKTASAQDTVVIATDKSSTTLQTRLARNAGDNRNMGEKENFLKP